MAYSKVLPQLTILPTKHCFKCIFQPSGKCTTKLQLDTISHTLVWHHQKRTVSFAENVEELKTPYIACWNVKWCSCFGKQFGNFSKQSNIKLPWDINKCTPRYTPRWNENLDSYKKFYMFVAALFIITKKLKQPKCSQTDKCINKMWYHPYIGILSGHLKEWNTDILKHGWMLKTWC